MRGLRTEWAFVAGATIAVVVQSVLNSSCLISCPITLCTVALNVAPRLVVEKAILWRSVYILTKNGSRITYQKGCVSSRIAAVVLLIHPESTRIACNRARTCCCSLNFRFDGFCIFDRARIIGCIIIDSIWTRSNFTIRRSETCHWLKLVSNLRLNRTNWRSRYRPIRRLRRSFSKRIGALRCSLGAGEDSCNVRQILECPHSDGSRNRVPLVEEIFMNRSVSPSTK